MAAQGFCTVSVFVTKEVVVIYKPCRQACCHRAEVAKPCALVDQHMMQEFMQDLIAVLDVLQGAIVTFTKGLSSHLISRGIRVNAIAPGPVWTPLVVASFPDSMVSPSQPHIFSFYTTCDPIHYC